MSLALELEDIAIGEADIASASETVARCLEAVDDEMAHKLYGAIRSWTWKALESRRRDDELLGWLEMIGRASSLLEGRWAKLACKLEVCAELVHASITVSSISQRRDLARRKHVREILELLHRNAEGVRRQLIAEKLSLKDANLSRIAAPLQDERWIRRIVEGRDVSYRLTEEGKVAWQRIARTLPGHDTTLQTSPRRTKTESERDNVQKWLHVTFSDRHHEPSKVEKRMADLMSKTGVRNEDDDVTFQMAPVMASVLADRRASGGVR